MERKGRDGKKLRKPTRHWGGWENLRPEIQPLLHYSRGCNFLGCTSSRTVTDPLFTVLLNYLLPLVYDLGGLVNVVHGPDEPGDLGPGWKQPHQFETSHVREDGRVREHRDLEVHPVL